VSAKAKLPALERRVLDVLSREEMQAMEEAAQSERNKLIVRLLADTGMRNAELIGLTLADLIVMGRERYVKVRGKTGERLVPLKPQVFERLRRFADRGRPSGVQSQSLFVGARRAPSRGGGIEQLTTSGLQQIIRGIAAVAGIERRVHPHLFRHSFITWQIKKGTHPIVIKKWVGHSPGSTIIDRVYAHVVESDTYDTMLRSLADD